MKFVPPRVGAKTTKVQAKSADDFQKIGMAAFRAGMARPEGESWQAKARQEGWDQALMDFQDAEDEKAVPKSEVVAEMVDEIPTAKVVASLADLPQAVSAHICDLAEQVQKTTPKRAQRLNMKINTLMARHGATTR